MRKIFAGVLMILSIFSSAEAAVSYRYVRLPQQLLDMKSTKPTAFIRDHIADDTYAFGYVPKGAKLPAAWTDALVDLDANAVAHRGIDPKTLRFRQEYTGDTGAKGSYHTYTTLTSDLKAIASKYPGLARLESAGKSVKGRDLWLLRLSSPTGTAAKLKLLYVAAMHGDEVVGKELLVQLAQSFLSGYGTDTRATALLDNAELFFMPSMNPDGTELRQRFNANGVDLNRDFPDVDESPFSESGRAIETVALMRLFQRNDFVLAANYHGGSIIVNLPWDHRPNPDFGDDALAMEIGREYAKTNLPMFGNHDSSSFENGVTYGYEWYQVLGGMQDWSSFFRQATHLTIELSDPKWPSASRLPQYWSDNQESLTRYLERGIFGVHLKVVDASGAPVAASVEISSATRALKYNDGLVHRPTTTASQHVRVSASGFRTAEFDVTPTAFRGTYRTVVLSR